LRRLKKNATRVAIIGNYGIFKRLLKIIVKSGNKKVFSAGG
jgi:hypothetical protein